jgi:hypothetical protein
MQQYPWYSVDSSSWVQIGAHGNIIMDGKTMAFSSQSPSRKNANQHIDSLPPIMKSAVERKITDMGYNPDFAKFNIRAGHSMQNSLSTWGNRSKIAKSFSTIFNRSCFHNGSR